MYTEAVPGGAVPSAGCRARCVGLYVTVRGLGCVWCRFGVWEKRKTWSTWSAVITASHPGPGELRSAPSGPDEISGSGYGLESPSPGGARSQGHNTGLRGLAPCTGFPLNCRTPPLYSELKNTLRGIVPRSGFPLAAERTLYSELVDTTLTTDTRIHTAPTQLLEDNTRIRSCETPIKKQRGKVRRL